MIKAHPLQWPQGWPRTDLQYRQIGRFGKKEQAPGKSWSSHKDLTVSDAVRRVREQLNMMGVGEDVVISTNLELRLDGLPRSSQPSPKDPGAAVYWVQRDGSTKVIALDLYNKVEHNLAAIAATLDAMRTIERHGGSPILERVFTGFTALPAPTTTANRKWFEVLGVPPNATADEIKKARNALAREAHPDMGGDSQLMAEINRAYEEAMKAQKEIAA